MSFPCLWSWVTAFLVVTFEAKAGLGQINGTRRNYITWRDLKMEGPPRNFPLRDIGGNYNRNKLVIVVDKYGRGDSFTVQGAVDMVPENNVQRVKIHILAGVYREKVRVPVNKPYISFIGDENEPSSTVITWHDKASDNLPNGGCCLGTWNSASVSIESDYFCATGITFEAMFYKARFLGSQDTLLDESGSHYFFRCFIQGSIDFIFGNGKSLYQECGISVVGDGYAIAAQHRNSDTDETGFAFLNCTVTGTGPIYLGRAWGNYSRIIYSYTEFDIDVRPQGWEDWRVPSRQSTVVYGEYECRGRGADRSRRVEWSKALSYWEARPFLDTMFIRGKQWLKL
ncbi:Pectinesterase QRT1 [Striga hermonthica]|uniref:Pectinesterase n=1 Tax=Striga hermonthica TaxID=68872 RepID=A0A9N7NE54_STRHE|nr:Pectinesterase QRT1 [Striga hermonthica]